MRPMPGIIAATNRLSAGGYTEPLAVSVDTMVNIGVGSTPSRSFGAEVPQACRMYLWTEADKAANPALQNMIVAYLYASPSLAVDPSSQVKSRGIVWDVRAVRKTLVETILTVARRTK